MSCFLNINYSASHSHSDQHVGVMATCMYSHVFWYIKELYTQFCKHDTKQIFSPKSFSSPEPMIPLACGRDRELWLGPTPDVCDSWTSHQIWQIWLVENTKRIHCTYSENRVQPELSIPATGQKDHGLSGQECTLVILLSLGSLLKVKYW